MSKKSKAEKKQEGEKKEETTTTEKPVEKQPAAAAAPAAAAPPAEKKEAAQKQEKKQEKKDAKAAAPGADKKEAKKEEAKAAPAAPVKQEPADRTLMYLLLAHTVLFAVVVGMMITQPEDTMFGQAFNWVRSNAAELGRFVTSQGQPVQIGAMAAAGVWFIGSNYFILNKVLG